jgi:WD40 repeat protein
MATAAGHTEFFVTGGTVPLSAESYVARSADKQLLDSLLAGKFCYVLNSRQMGKSSLCVRTIAKLRESGVRTALVDLTKIGGRNVTPDQWYAGLMSDIGRELNLRAQVLSAWKEYLHLSPMQRFFEVLREVVLQGAGSLAIFIDEIDTTRSLAFSTDEFFAAIRECYNRRAQDPEYNRLCFCLLGVAVPSDLIQDAKTTPFNIGERIYLRDFTLEETAALSEGLGDRRSLVGRVHYWTNGHPFLTQSLCHAIENDAAIRSERDVDALIDREFFQPRARKTHINLADVGNRVLNSFSEGEDVDKYRADILSAYRKALKGREALSDDESNQISAALKLSGLMRSDGNQLKVRNPIYARVFGEDWVRENMPGQEFRRQRRAFGLGVLRAACISAAVIVVVGYLAINNAKLARQASSLARTERAERDQANYRAYVADVNAMQMASDTPDPLRLQNLLIETSNSPHKNFEWRYWYAQLNNSDYSAPFPLGPADVAIAADQKSVAIEDFHRRKVEFFTLPDLRIVRSASMPKKDEFVWQFGGRWVSAAFDGTWTMDDLASGRPIATIAVADGKLNWLSGRSSSLAVAAPYLKNGEIGWRHVMVWSIKDSKIIKNLDFDTVIGSNVGLSDDGKIISLIMRPEDSKQHDRLCAVEASSGKTLDSMDWPKKNDAMVAGLSADGRRLFASGESGFVAVRDVASHKTVFRATLASNELATLSLSRDGRRLLTFVDSKSMVWNLDTGKVIDQRSNLINPRLTPDGRFLLDTGAGTRVYRIGKMETESIHMPDMAPLRTDSQGRWVMASVNGMTFLDPISLSVKKLIPCSTVKGLLGVGAGGRYVFASLKTGHSILMDSETGNKVVTLPMSSYFGPAASNDARVLSLMDRDFHTLRVLDGQGKELWHTRLNAAAFVSAVSPDGKFVAAGMYDGNVDLFDALSGELLREMTDSAMCIRSIEFSRDSSHLATGGDDSTALIYDLKRQSVPVECRANFQSIYSVSFSPDGTRLLTSGDEGPAMLWDADSGEQLLRLGSVGAMIRSAEFSEDGKQICTSNDRDEIHVYRAP